MWPQNASGAFVKPGIHHSTIKQNTNNGFQRKGDSHSVSGAVQLLPLLSQLFDDVTAYLLRLVGNLLTSLDALAGVIQRLGALKQQRSLRLLVCLQSQEKKKKKEYKTLSTLGELIFLFYLFIFFKSNHRQCFWVTTTEETHTSLVFRGVDATTSFIGQSGEAKARGGGLHVPLQLPEVPAIQAHFGTHGISVGRRCGPQLVLHTL